jgi:glycosyltransferase involved in cell wall biosynthesis
MIKNTGFPKNGWPWEAPNQTIPLLQDSPAWPRITIITPSYNQGQFLEETIRSVLLQGYPNLEYMVIDGGSTDNSVEIIKKYAPWIDYWVSEPDRGQAHAINKGFARCTGDIVGWINSDDLLLPGSLTKVATAYISHPNKILLGDVIHFDEDRRMALTVKQRDVSFKNLALQPISKCAWQQPGTFIPTGSIPLGRLALDESLRYTFDLDWMCRLLQIIDVFYLSEPVARFRLHPNSKTVKEKLLWLPEIDEVFKRYWEQVSCDNKAYLSALFELFHAAIFLGGYTWELERGRQYMQKALRLYPQIRFTFRFFELSIRTVLPYPVVKNVKKIYKQASHSDNL